MSTALKDVPELNCYSEHPLDQTNPSTLATGSLVVALTHLRPEIDGHYMWEDAICNNREDVRAREDMDSAANARSLQLNYTRDQLARTSDSENGHLDSSLKLLRSCRRHLFLYLSAI